MDQVSEVGILYSHSAAPNRMPVRLYGQREQRHRAAVEGLTHDLAMMEATERTVLDVVGAAKRIDRAGQTHGSIPALDLASHAELAKKKRAAALS